MPSPLAYLRTSTNFRFKTDGPMTKRSPQALFVAVFNFEFCVRTGLSYTLFRLVKYDMNSKATLDYEHECPMCGNTITGIEKAGSWTDRTKGGGFWLVAVCANCDIDFRLTVRRGKPGSWRMIATSPSELIEMVDAEEFESLNNKLLRYKKLGQK